VGDKTDLRERFPEVSSVLDLQDALRDLRKRNNEVSETAHRLKFAYPDAANILASLRNIDRSLLVALQILQGRR